MPSQVQLDRLARLEAGTALAEHQGAVVVPDVNDHVAVDRVLAALARAGRCAPADHAGSRTGVPVAAVQ